MKQYNYYFDWQDNKGYEEIEKVSRKAASAEENKAENNGQLE